VSHRLRGSGVVALVVLSIAVTACSSSRRPTTARDGISYYRSHRTEFASILTLVSSGKLGDRSTWPYYGAKLPRRLCTVSANCRVANIKSTTSQAILFIPAWIGTPDDAAGWGHFDGRPTGGPFDGFGMLICPMQEAGEGWWWLDRPPPAPGRPPTCALP
jgi:hypothetical protein